MQIAFIGGGVMAEAIIGGIIESKIANAQDVHVGEPVEALILRTHTDSPPTPTIETPWKTQA